MNFPLGLHQLNENVHYNFQLNRLINWDGGDLNEVSKVSQQIQNNADWKTTLIQLGDQAFREGRLQNAIGYYRMSEFFMLDTDRDKLHYYRLAVKLFYEEYADYFSSGIVERTTVPFENISLPVLHTKSRIPKKGILLIHGGNDSYLEEFFWPMIYFSERGYEVYLFEGPGQGGVLREQGTPFTHEWEKPVKALLDHFHLNEVAIIGISLGGMLAPRAAAFEKRIRYIVAWSVFPNFLDIALHHLPGMAQKLVRGLLKLGCQKTINSMVRYKAKKDPLIQWIFQHGMYAYDANSPYEYLKKLDQFQLLDIAKNIDQDLLILHGKKDHFIDWQLYQKEINALKNARSITFRLFTDRESASDHCQCGNTPLALNTILHWLESLKSP